MSTSTQSISATSSSLRVWASASAIHIDGDEALGRLTCDIDLDVRRLAGAVPALEVDELVDEGASRFGDGLLDGEPDRGSVGAP